MPVENGSSPASSQYSSAPSDHRSARFPSYVLYSSTCAPAPLSAARAACAGRQSGPGPLLEPCEGQHPMESPTCLHMARACTLCTPPRCAF
jgi:hypothetical protein